MTKKNYYPGMFFKAQMFFRKHYHDFMNSSQFMVENSVKGRFGRKLKRELDLINPVKYNDKIHWLKLYWKNPLAQKCADKYEVREYVKEKIGEKYLNTLYGVYDSVQSIDINKLPVSFVLKGTHGSGFNIICRDKLSFDWKKRFREMYRWLNTNYFWSSKEWVYKNSKPRIVCEKLLSDKSGNLPKDYKIFCFGGVPKLICVDIDREDKHKRNFYDLNWNFLDIQISKKLNSNNPEIKIKKPDQLEEMIELSRVLSQDFPHVRTDFYIVNNKVCFGELTFFHASGLSRFYPPEFENEMGKWIKLPVEKETGEWGRLPVEVVK